jgi:phosphatidate cytidylyltransferase
MLKQRLLTAIFLVPLIVWVLSLSTQTVAWFLCIFVVLGAWEWAGLCGGGIRRHLYTAVVGLVLAYWLWQQPWSNIYILIILLAACLWWLLALYWVLRYQQGHSLVPSSPFIKALLGFFILLPAWMALLILHKDYGWHWVVFLLVLIWTADSGAYFAGRRWGSRKLADQISPGKTWEGVAGALLMSSMVSLGYALYQSMSLMTLNLFMLLCLLTVVASILGDLLESLLCANVDIYSMNTKVFSTVTMWINQQLTLILKKVGGQ